MSNPPLAYVDEAGLHVPAYDEIRDYLVGRYQGIYGADVYLDDDSQDGQLLSLFAQMLHDQNSLAVAIYNGFRPAGAQGVPLSRLVKINGIRRKTPTYSTADLRVVGQAGLVIQNGAAQDLAGVKWLLPASVTIPLSGEIVVTATADQIGAISAPTGTISAIATPTAGWQEVSNPAAAAPGAPVESDAQLRIRQGLSTQIPATSPHAALLGALMAQTGVTEIVVYENDQDVYDAFGLPPHSLSVVVDGGNLETLAGILATTKTLGVATFGLQSVVVRDTAGTAKIVRLSRPADVAITYQIVVRRLAGYTVDVETAIRQAVSDWTMDLSYGAQIAPTDAIVPARLTGASAKTFKIVSVLIARDGGVPAGATLSLGFNERPSCVPGYISVSVQP